MSEEAGHVGCSTNPTAPHSASYTFYLVSVQSPLVAETTFPFTVRQQFILKRQFFSGDVGDSIHYLFPRPVLLHEAAEPCSRVFPPLLPWLLLESLEIFRHRVCHMICMRFFFFTYQPYLTHMSPGGLWTYCSNHSVSILSGDSLSRFPLSFKNQ